MKPVIIDVRERDEFKAEHIKDSINIPLSEFQTIAPGVIVNLKGKKIELMCLSGRRSQMALNMISQMGFSSGYDIRSKEGGIKRYKEDGGETVASQGNHLPILRQVHLAAGFMAFFGVLAGFYINPSFFYLSGFVGLGLAFAGATGTCLMASFLAWMPWNRSRGGVQTEVCISGRGSQVCTK